MNKSIPISAKIFEVINAAIQMPPQKDGVRRARALVVCSGEANQNHAIDYALRSVRALTGYSVTLKSFPHYFLFDAEIKFSLPDKSSVFLELVFLKEDSATEKSLGFEASVWITLNDKCLSSDKEAALNARCGRFPSLEQVATST